MCLRPCVVGLSGCPPYFLQNLCTPPRPFQPRSPPLRPAKRSHPNVHGGGGFCGNKKKRRRRRRKGKNVLLQRSNRISVMHDRGHTCARMCASSVFASNAAGWGSLTQKKKERKKRKHLTQETPAEMKKTTGHCTQHPFQIIPSCIRLKFVTGKKRAHKAPSTVGT